MPEEKYGVPFEEKKIISTILIILVKKWPWKKYNVTHVPSNRSTWVKLYFHWTINNGNSIPI